jgi:teichuronic acid biosynthesis glycosyltransferase TuaG
MNLVSIIIPVYNSEMYISTLLISIENQTFKKWKAIIINDASSDSTVEKIRPFLKNKKFELINLKVNKGVAYCRNLGLEKVKSSYVCFVDSDDFWEKDKLTYQYNAMKKKKIDFSYSSYRPFKIVDNKFYYLSIVKMSKKPFSLEKFVKNTAICTSSIMIKKNVIDNIRFNPKYRFDDYLFKCNILLQPIKILSIKKNLVNYLIRKDSISSNVINNIIDVWKINKNENRFSFLKNLKCISFIIINSLRRYGFNKI